VKKTPNLLSTFLLGKVGPFTLENYIHVKALKTQGFPKKIDAVLNHYLKNSTQTIVQGCTP